MTEEELKQRLKQAEANLFILCTDILHYRQNHFIPAALSNKAEDMLKTIRGVE